MRRIYDLGLGLRPTTSMGHFESLPRDLVVDPDDAPLPEPALPVSLAFPVPEPVPTFAFVLF